MRLTVQPPIYLRPGDVVGLSDRRGEWRVTEVAGDQITLVRRHSRTERILVGLVALNVALAAALPTHWPNLSLAVLYSLLYLYARRR